MPTKTSDDKDVKGTLGDAEVTSRSNPARDDLSQSWPEVHTHYEADEQAKQRGIEWPETANPGPEGRLTIQQKQAILNGQEIDPAQKTGMR